MKSLIIEDDYISSKIFLTALKQYGKCDTATTGYNGLSMFNQALAGEAPYELVVIDIILPDINGYEILKQIRKKEQEQLLAGVVPTKIILTTSLDDEENKKIAKKLNTQNETYYVKGPRLNGFIEKIVELGIKL